MPKGSFLTFTHSQKKTAMLSYRRKDKENTLSLQIKLVAHCATVFTSDSLDRQIFWGKLYTKKINCHLELFLPGTLEEKRTPIILHTALPAAWFFI